MGMVLNLLRVSDSELGSYLNDSSLLEKRLDNEESEDLNLVDIDKAWEGILFLLTGSNLESMTHPLSRLLFSGQLIDEEQDLGYGPGNYLTPEQVKEIGQEISAISEVDLRKAFDVDRMTELTIYPNSWKSEGIFDYLAEYFTVVKEVYATATQEDQGIITFLS